MSQQDFPGDPLGTGSRKTAFHYRRGSSSASAPSVSDDNPTQAGSSSPGLHHHQQQQPPQSQMSGAQVKKKSGFQITSVTSAQINVSGNNSLADDTESYDDMDESHTEDLSSDMLDVSVPRATEAGVPERSSSDETLNSLHGVDTPGLVSPNEPIQPQGSMVNGTVPHQQQQQQYYPQQQHSHHHSNSLGGGEPLLSTPPPLASSSPALASKAGTSQTQRPAALDNTKPAAGTTQPPAGEVHPSGGSVTNTVAGAAVLAAVFDNASAPSGGGSGPASAAPAAVAAPAAPTTQTHHTQTQAATGSRFRVVKLDTNSEPFRKGRWTCTEFYEKEVPPAAAAAEPSKGSEASATAAAPPQEGEAASATQPPHTLQPYQQPNQDFTSPKAVQSPPQPATAPLTSYATPQEAGSGLNLQKPAVAPLQALPYAVEAQQQQQQQQGGYAVPPQLHTGVLAVGGGRQPDFIQPTAPFQTQVQPPLPLVTKGISPVPVVPGVTAVQPPQSLPPRGQGAPPTQVVYPPQPAQPQPQHQLQTAAPVAGLLTAGGPAAHAAPPMPLTAVLQPLLAPGATFAPASGRASQLEDAQKLLLQHQGLLSLPRLGMVAGGEGAAVGGAVAAASLAHIGMSAEATAFMAAAAGLRSQHGEGEEDSSSGASVVAIDNKIEQAMDLVKSHLMYAVREEVEVLKEQIKDLIERNTQLEQENNLLKNLASPEQMAQFQAQVQTGGSPTGSATSASAAQQPPGSAPPSGPASALPPGSSQNSGASA